MAKKYLRKLIEFYFIDSHMHFSLDIFSKEYFEISTYDLDSIFIAIIVYIVTSEYILALIVAIEFLSRSFFVFLLSLILNFCFFCGL